MFEVRERENFAREIHEKSMGIESDTIYIERVVPAISGKPHFQTSFPLPCALFRNNICSVPEFQKRNFPTTVLVSLYEY